MRNNVTTAFANDGGSSSSVSSSEEDGNTPYSLKDKVSLKFTSDDGSSSSTLGIPTFKENPTTFVGDNDDTDDSSPMHARRTRETSIPSILGKTHGGGLKAHFVEPPKSPRGRAPKRPSRPEKNRFRNVRSPDGPRSGGDDKKNIDAFNASFDSNPGPGGSNSKSSSKKKKKKKKKGVKLDAESAMQLESNIQMNLTKHLLASKYFIHRQFWYFTTTQAVLTMAASIFAFVASSEILNDKQKTILNLGVGSISAFVVFIQTMSGVCSYGERGGMHENLSVDLRDLRDDITLIRFKLCKLVTDDDEKKGLISADSSSSGSNSNSNSYSYSYIESNYSSEDDSDSDDDDDEEHHDTFESIQNRYRQSLGGCKSNVPMELSDAFQGLDSHLQVTRSLDNNLYMHQVYGHSRFNNIVYFKAYDILCAEILGYFWYPWGLPCPKKCVEETMRRLQNELDAAHKYWAAQVKENYGAHPDAFKHSFFYNSSRGHGDSEY